MGVRGSRTSCQIACRLMNNACTKEKAFHFRNYFSNSEQVHPHITVHLRIRLLFVLKEADKVALWNLKFIKKIFQEFVKIFYDSSRASFFSISFCATPTKTTLKTNRQWLISSKKTKHCVAFIAYIFANQSFFWQIQFWDDE